MSLNRLLAIALAAAVPCSAIASDQSETHWVDSWASAQQVPEPDNRLPADFASDFTLRQVVHLSLGGRAVRVRLSNLFGTTPLTIDAAAVARARAPGTSAIVDGSTMALHFGGRASVTIPAGAEFDSDPVAMAVPAGVDLAISLHYVTAPTGQTGHPGSRSTSFLLAGRHVADASLPGAAAIEHWYQLSDVEVAGSSGEHAVVAIGDSITDGHGATIDRNRRWPDRLAERLQRTAGDTAVINTGIGGNRILEDGLGPNLMARFDRDALDRPGVTSVIVLEGVNDIGVLTRLKPIPAAALAAHRARLIDGLRRLVDRAHARGIRVYGGTITPFVGSDYYHPDAGVDADRRAINDWIRTPGHFDGVVDFDRALRDPAHPERLRADFDSGDHLHPSDAGYAAMAAAGPSEATAASGIPAQPSDGGPAVAITFDDLPAHGPLPPGDTRLAIMSRISAALKAAGVPPTYGFTNGSFAEREPAAKPALRAWRSDGNVLANHSWSHMNANENPVAAWEADVIRNEALIAPLMADADWRWLRFPYLAEGETPAKRREIRRFLGAHRYKIASVTMSFSDYLWNEPYSLCATTGNAPAIGTLERSYLAAAAASLEYSLDASRRIVGREIPLVLLLHVGAFDARMLPDLIALYRARGVRFVSLAEAEADPFYRGDIEPDRGSAPATFDAAAAAHRVTLPVPPAPPPDLATICQ